MDSGPIGWHLAVQLVLFVLCALLQAADTAARTININKLRRDAEMEDPLAVKIDALIGRLRENPSGIQTGMVVFAFMAIISAVASYAAALANVINNARGDTFFSDAVVFWFCAYLVIMIVTFLYMLFARAVPIMLARRNADALLRKLYPFTRFMDALFRPLSWLIMHAAKALIRLSGVDPEIEIEQVTEDEIRMMVDAGEEKGAIEESERNMIENVFEFNNMSAGDCMTHRTDMYAIWDQETDENILKMIEDTGLSRFPVYTEDLDHIIGTVTTRDYLTNRVQPDPKPLKALLRPARFVPESVRTDYLFREMQKDKVHMAVVVDEYGGTSGLITMEDLLEEIVGNIYDEYDPLAQQDIIDKGDGKWLVSGGVEIERFNEETGLNLPLEEDYDTIGGLILSQLASIPDDGTNPEVAASGLNFRVLEVLDRRIEWVEVRQDV